LNISASNISSRKPSPVESLKKRSKHIQISPKTKINDDQPEKYFEN